MSLLPKNTEAERPSAKFRDFRPDARAWGFFYVVN